MTPLERLSNLTKSGAWRSAPTSNRRHITWSDDYGIGFLPSSGFEYGRDYWEKYVDMANTQMGCDLSEARFKFVTANAPELLTGQPKTSALCDVGIGSGQFVLRAGCRGYDINPHAVEWLVAYGRYIDPLRSADITALSYWDVLEHIENPTPMLSRVNKLFVSVPIHKSLEACLVSKHLRPDEHLWHFTDAGFREFVTWFGFEVKASSDVETKLGREDIMSYYCERV